MWELGPSTNQLLFTAIMIPVFIIGGIISIARLMREQHTRRLMDSQPPVESRMDNADEKLAWDLYYQSKESAGE